MAWIVPSRQEIEDAIADMPAAVTLFGRPNWFAFCCIGYRPVPAAGRSTSWMAVITYYGGD